MSWVWRATGHGIWKQAHGRLLGKLQNSGLSLIHGRRSRKLVTAAKGVNHGGRCLHPTPPAFSTIGSFRLVPVRTVFGGKVVWNKLNYVQSPDLQHQVWELQQEVGRQAQLVRRLQNDVQYLLNTKEGGITGQNPTNNPHSQIQTTPCYHSAHLQSANHSVPSQFAPEDGLNCESDIGTRLDDLQGKLGRLHKTVDVFFKAVENRKSHFDVLENLILDYKGEVHSLGGSESRIEKLTQKLEGMLEGLTRERKVHEKGMDAIMNQLEMLDGRIKAQETLILGLSGRTGVNGVSREGMWGISASHVGLSVPFSQSYAPVYTQSNFASLRTILEEGLGVCEEEGATEEEDTLLNQLINLGMPAALFYASVEIVDDELLWQNQLDKEVEESESEVEDENNIRDAQESANGGENGLSAFEKSMSFRNWTLQAVHVGENVVGNLEDALPPQFHTPQVGNVECGLERPDENDGRLDTENGPDCSTRGVRSVTEPEADEKHVQTVLPETNCERGVKEGSAVCQSGRSGDSGDHPGVNKDEKGVESVDVGVEGVGDSSAVSKTDVEPGSESGALDIMQRTGLAVPFCLDSDKDSKDVTRGDGHGALNVIGHHKDQIIGLRMCDTDSGIASPTQGEVGEQGKEGWKLEADVERMISHDESLTCADDDHGLLPSTPDRSGEPVGNEGLALSASSSPRLSIGDENQGGKFPNECVKQREGNNKEIIFENPLFREEAPPLCANPFQITKLGFTFVHNNPLFGEEDDCGGDANAECEKEEADVQIELTTRWLSFDDFAFKLPTENQEDMNGIGAGLQSPQASIQVRR